MHPAAYEWVTAVAPATCPDPIRELIAAGREVPLRGLDVGAGGPLGDAVRRLFPWVAWTTVDWNPDTEPDVATDLSVMRLPEQLPAEGFPVVLCTEVLEHVPGWRMLVSNCVRLVAPGGHLVLTCAGPEREPHSAVDGGPLREGEHYANVDPHELSGHLLQLTVPYGLVLRQLVHATGPHDIYLHAEVHRA